MADERPLDLVQLVADYFDTGTLSETLGSPNHFVEAFYYHYSNSELASCPNIFAT